MSEVTTTGYELGLASDGPEIESDYPTTPPLTHPH